MYIFLRFFLKVYPERFWPFHSHPASYRMSYGSSGYKQPKVDVKSRLSDSKSIKNHNAEVGNT